MDDLVIDIHHIDVLKQRLFDAKKYLNIDKLTEELVQLQKKSEESTFWNNSEKAASILRKINSYNDSIESYNGSKKLLDDLMAAYELSLVDNSFLEEANTLYKQLEQNLENLELKSWFCGEFDSQDAIMSINPGSGGKEAQDWTDMLYKMYLRFAKSQGWKVKTLLIVPGDGIGLDKVTMQIMGQNAYGMLKSENGVHRLVRISPTDEKNRRHTTFAGVEVLPMLPNDIDIEIEDKDIRVDVYRSSGPGGQSVNTTDSAVRITHLPSGIVVTCQNEKSQIQNKESAMSVLRSKLYELEQRKRQDKVNQAAGDKAVSSFGSQIRNYVMYPYTLVKDLRSGYESGNVEAVLNGDILEFIKSYHKHINTK